MIARLISWCVHNRGMVLLLTACLVAVGIWSTYRITVDAIPDLSDVQVVIRTDYPGRAPQIVQDQVTTPLTNAMLAVPGAEVVRGQSMFGTSFLYIIFEDGTDLYWARSRVLEQVSTISAQLPEDVEPQLGPDATGVGWVYQYVLTTGRYCPNPDHARRGIWHDPQTDEWHERPDDAPARERLKHYRVFDRTRETCPIDGKALKESNQDLSDLRGLQDWLLRYELTPVAGVSEVAPIGGFVKQYQVVVDPVKLLAYDMSLDQVKQTIQASNRDAGGRVIERGETEYMVRSLGYLGQLPAEEVERIRKEGGSLEQARTERALAQLRKVSLRTSEDGEPVYLDDVANVQVGPEIRRGIADLDGRGEVVGGIVVMRHGANARDTIDAVRAKLASVEQSLPPGVAAKTVYDRSDLIDRSMDTLRHTLIEEIVVVSLVIVLFLLHARSALVAAFVLPTGVLATLAVMHGIGINANIMSLGGIAISIGVMVDSAIVMVENAHKHLERENRHIAAGRPPRHRATVIAEAAAEVGPTLFFSLLIITISFLPIFVLSGQSGRLFQPLAYTKTFAMAAAALLAVTIVPVLMVYFIRERIVPRHWSWMARIGAYTLAMALPAIVLAVIPLPTLSAYRWWMVGGWVVLSALVMLPQGFMPEQRNPLSWLLQKAYEPVFELVMHHRWLTLGGAVLLVVATIWPLRQLGSEFMPPLTEGDLLYMPTTDPGLSTTKARELLQQTDKLIAQFPEVKRVFGKIGRAESATDPAPMNMIETTIMLHRDKRHWRHVPKAYTHWPVGTRWLGRTLFGDTRPITMDELVFGYNLPRPGEDQPIHIQGLDEAVQFPGLTNSWTMPIRTRIDMLSTGIKTPIGIKVMGPDLDTLAATSQRIADVLRTDARTRDDVASAYADKSTGGHYLHFNVNAARDEIARYGLNVSDVQDTIESAIGGMNISHTVEGLARYPINVRYPRELRDNVARLKQVLIATPTGAQVPLGQLVPIEVVRGAPMIKSENGRLTSWIYVDISNIDVGTFVQRARQVVDDQVELPTGYSLAWSGQYEYMQETWQRLKVAAPAALMAIVLLLYLATRSWFQVILVALTVALFAPVGSIWLLWLQGYNLSGAVWVGMIALMGLAAETGLVMLLYLENSVKRYEAEGRLRDANDLWYAIHEGAVQRIRPKTMTVVTTFTGLLPLMLTAQGAGADTMRRLAAPMVGGLFTAFILELLIYPVVFYLAMHVRMRTRLRAQASTTAHAEPASEHVS